MNKHFINKKPEKKIIVFIILVCMIHVLNSVDPSYAKKYVILSFVKNKILQKILLQAAADGNESFIINSIKRNVELNIQNDKGYTPLIIAVLYGHYDIVKTLVLAGAKLYIEDKTGKKALDYALEKENKKIAEILIKATKSS